MVSNAPSPGPANNPGATSASDPLNMPTGYAPTGAVQPQVQPAAGAGRRRAVPAKAIAWLIILVAAVWFILANRQHADIKLWVPTVTAPVWLVLLITFAAGTLLGLTTPRLMRRRRAKAAARRGH
jgi:uncharacterized integral membrane protein